MGQALDVGERDVPLAAFDGRHVCAVQFAFVGQALLGPLILHAQQPHPVRGRPAQVGRIGQPCGGVGLAGTAQGCGSALFASTEFASQLPATLWVFLF